MSWKVTNLDIDGTIPAQTALLPRLGRVIDLRALEQGLRLWPGGNALAAVRQAVQEIQTGGRQLVFYGSGDLNFISALLLASLPRSARPLTLVLFDNHPDWFTLGPRYHCGNWVAAALKLPWVEQVYLIGQDSADLDGHNFWFSPLKDLLSGRVRLYPYRRQRVTVPAIWLAHGSSVGSREPSGTGLEFQTIVKLGVPALAEQLCAELAGKNVYIAIDKDVLNPDYAACDWEQGQLTLDELLLLVRSISRSANIVGADICGEQAEAPLKGLLKRLDAGRLAGGSKVEYPLAVSINEKSNLALLDALLSCRAPHMEKVCI